MSKQSLQTIFLVEDDPDIQIIAEMTFEEIGDYELSIFGSGMKLFDALETRMPQLILLDVMLPEMDGPSILKKLKAEPRTSAIPVIFMTAKVRPTDQREYNTSDVLGVIGKPFDPEEMVQTVERLWDKHSNCGSSDPEIGNSGGGEV